MKVYLLLFCLGFANEGLLTSYYINASKGLKWRCVALSLSQQAVSIAATFFTLVDVAPGSREQFTRWIVTALSYGIATYFVVGNKNPSKETSTLGHNHDQQNS